MRLVKRREDNIENTYIRELLNSWKIFEDFLVNIQETDSSNRIRRSESRISQLKPQESQLIRD